MANIATRFPKSIFSVAGRDATFLPVTKAMAKELFPIIIVTGRPRRAIGDHCNANLKPEFRLSQEGKHTESDIVPERVSSIFIHEPKPKRLVAAELTAALDGGDAFDREEFRGRFRDFLQVRLLRPETDVDRVLAIKVDR